MRVPYRSEEDIERSAEALLAEFTNDRGLVVQPPVPVEDIMEKHLKLCLGFDQLHELLGVPQVGPQPDIFGAIWVERGEILIDQSLDPDERPPRSRVGTASRSRMRADTGGSIALCFRQTAGKARSSARLRDRA